MVYLPIGHVDTVSISIIFFYFLSWQRGRPLVILSLFTDYVTLNINLLMNLLSYQFDSIAWPISSKIFRHKSWALNPLTGITGRFPITIFYFPIHPFPSSRYYPLWLSRIKITRHTVVLNGTIYSRYISNIDSWLTVCTS